MLSHPLTLTRSPPLPSLATALAATPAAKAAPSQPSQPAAVASAAASEGKDKKKRNANPGVRIQGGRVYDSENGTTCHQCRQKTIEVKAKCTTCTLYFCPRCLENRYSEKVDESNALGNWSCPKCRKECNCSNCRKKAGLQATGILANVAKTAGFSSVSDLLQRNPNAKAIHHKNKTDAAAIEANAAAAAGQPGSSKTPTTDTNKKKRKTGVSQPGKDITLVDDSTLGERPAPFPAIHPLILTKGDVTSAPGGGIKRGRAPTWLSSLSDDDDDDDDNVPVDVNQHELAAVMEFIAVFCYPPPSIFTSDGTGDGNGGKKAAVDDDNGNATAKTSPVAINRLPPLSALAHELLQQPLTQPSTTTTNNNNNNNKKKKSNNSNSNINNKLLCPSGTESPCARIHCALLQVVRQAWGIQGSVTIPAWQRLMEAYYAANQMDGEVGSSTGEVHGPPAIAGELLIRPHPVGTTDDGTADKGGTTSPSPDDDGTEKNDDQVKKSTTTAVPSLLLPSFSNHNAIQYPEGGYWAVPPGVRVSMLSSLIHDALDTWPMREYIESTMLGSGGGGGGGGNGGMITAEEKERKNELADARKEARAAAAAQRDKELAMLIAGTDAKALTLEEQRALMEQARVKAEQSAEEAAAAAMAKVSALTVVSASRTFHHPPTVRAPFLGSDLEGRRYVQLQCSNVLGSATPDSDVVVLIENKNNDDDDIVLGTVGDLKGLVTALHPTGKCEGPLRRAVLTAFKMKDPVLSSMKKKKMDDGVIKPVPSPLPSVKEEATPKPKPASAGKAIKGKSQAPNSTTVTASGMKKKRKQSATPAITTSKKSRSKGVDVQEQQDLPLKVDDALTGVAA